MPNNNKVWENTLDDRFLILVERVDEYTGHLSVTDTKTENVIYGKDVTLSYGAKFGVDALDVNQWEIDVMNFVDTQYDPAKTNSQV